MPVPVVSVHYADDWLTVYQGDCRAVMAELEPESVHCVVTSPPYWGLRDYGVAGQLGLEASPELYVDAMVEVLRAVRRVLRQDGTVWLNLGDSYNNRSRLRDTNEQPGLNGVVDSTWRQDATRGRTRASSSAGGLKEKDLVGVPWMVAFALRADGWYLRRDVIWSKPNPMPESVTDRPTTAHEYIFLLSRSERYYYDAEAVRERAESGPSDLRKMAEGRERIGGLVKEQDDPLLKASSHTNIGRKRSVGGRPLKVPSGWNAGDSHNDRIGRYSGGKQRLAAEQSTGTHGDRLAGFNDRWDASEDEGSAPAGRNLRSVWTIATQPYPGAHFATFPETLPERCILASCPEGGTVLDPFAGSGTTGRVANRLSRRAVLIDLSLDYLDQAMVRNAQSPMGLVG